MNLSIVLNSITNQRITKFQMVKLFLSLNLVKLTNLGILLQYYYQMLYRLKRLLQFFLGRFLRFSVVNLVVRATVTLYAFAISLTTILLYMFIRFDKLNRAITSIAGKISKIRIPKCLRKIIFKLYSKYYNVKCQEIIKPLQQFQTFEEFFIRRIYPRTIEKGKQIIISPVDSKILAISQITSDKCTIIKNVSYSLGHLITGNSINFTSEQINNLKSNINNKLYQIIFYLSPGDYHHFHSPSYFEIYHQKNMKGTYYSVNQVSLRNQKDIYTTNLRYSLNGHWKQGYMTMVMIGALNVGNIVVFNKNNFNQGEEMGYFNLGSTVVLIFQAKGIKQWKKQQNDTINYGQAICEVESQ